MCYVSPVNAAERDCTKEALFKDQSAVRKDYVLKTALIQSMSRDEWEDHQTSTSGQAVVYGVPVKGSYSDAKSWSNRFQDASGFALDERNTTSEVTSRLSQNGLEAYKACLEKDSNDQLLLTVTRATPKLIVIEGKWRPTFEADFFQGIDVGANGAEIISRPPRHPVPNTSWQFQLRRQPDNEVSVLVTMTFKDGKGDLQEISREVYVPPYLDVEVRRESRQRESDQIYMLRPGSGATETTANIDERPTEGYRIVDGSVSVNWTMCRTLGSPQPSCTDHLEVRPERISGTIKMTHPPAHAAEAADAKIRWAEERYVIVRNGQIKGSF